LEISAQDFSIEDIEADPSEKEGREAGDLPGAINMRSDHPLLRNAADVDERRYYQAAE